MPRFQKQDLISLGIKIVIIFFEDPPANWGLGLVFFCDAIYISIYIYIRVCTRVCGMADLMDRRMGKTPVIIIITMSRRPTWPRTHHIRFAFERSSERASDKSAIDPASRNSRTGERAGSQVFHRVPVHCPDLTDRKNPSWRSYVTRRGETGRIGGARSALGKVGA